IPRVDLRSYVEPKAIARTVHEQDGGRYLTLGSGSVYDRGSNDMLLFHNESTDGYNPIQLLRYWSFVRAAQHISLEYHRSFFVRPTGQVLDLLQVEWVVAPANAAVDPTWTHVAQQ